jgi:hypothetical protein
MKSLYIPNVTEHYAWHSDDDRDYELADRLANNLLGFYLKHDQTGLLVLVKEEFTNPPDPEPHFLHSYQLGHVYRLSPITCGLASQMRGIRITQNYSASCDNDGYDGMVSIIICVSYGSGTEEVAKQACEYMLDQYKLHIEELYFEWRTDYLDEPVIETYVEWQTS